MVIVKYQEPWLMNSVSSFYPPTRKPNSKVQYIRVDATKCIGCEACTDACKEHRGHRGVSVIFIDKVSRYGHAGLTCFQCPDAPCLKICPVEAIKRSPKGIVMQPDPAFCISCGLCEVGCPYGVMVLDGFRSWAVKCDTCLYRRSSGSKSLCISVCPVNAITLQTLT